ATLGNLQVNSWRSAINRKAVGSNLVCRAKHLSTSRSAVSWYEVPKHANSSGMPNTARNKTWIEGRSHAPTRLERPHRRIENGRPHYPGQAEVANPPSHHCATSRHATERQWGGSSSPLVGALQTIQEHPGRALMANFLEGLLD